MSVINPMASGGGNVLQVATASVNPNAASIPHSVSFEKEETVIVLPNTNAANANGNGNGNANGAGGNINNVVIPPGGVAATAAASANNSLNGGAAAANAAAAAATVAAIATAAAVAGLAPIAGSSLAPRTGSGAPNSARNKDSATRSLHGSMSSNSLKEKDEIESHNLYDAIANDGVLTRTDFEHAITDSGIMLSDPRMKEVVRRLNELTYSANAANLASAATAAAASASLASASSSGLQLPPAATPAAAANAEKKKAATPAQLRAAREAQTLTYEQFDWVIQPCALLIERILQQRLVIPDWQSFTDSLKQMYDEVVAKPNEGKCADYIPELKSQNPNHFGVAFTSIDGQHWEIGDSTVEFSVQSCSKPLTYLMGLEECGSKMTHRFVGREPSGRSFNELSLNKDNLPHNPMINSGAIMCTSLIKPQADPAARFKHFMETWTRLAQGFPIGFSNTTYLSERDTADRNFCLGYMMNEKGAFKHGKDRDAPPRAWGQHDLHKNLELYFQICSITANASSMSAVAAALAHGGVCPMTGDRVFRSRHVRNALSLMLSCGMYDYSGEWAYEVGIPAKSGVSGCIMSVIPGVGGIAVFSPPLDPLGNSLRGMQFCRKLVKLYSFHYYDMINGIVNSQSKRKDPTLASHFTEQYELVNLSFYCARGDLHAIRGMAASGCRLDGQDYDGRTPLHVATSEGQLHVVKYLVSKGVSLNVLDRWGGTPLSDAVRHGHASVAAFLQSKGAVMGNSSTAREFSFSKIDGNLTQSAIAAAATASNTTQTGGNSNSNNTTNQSVLTPKGSNASPALALAGVRKQQFQVSGLLQREGGGLAGTPREGHRNSASNPAAGAPIGLPPQHHSSHPAGITATINTNVGMSSATISTPVHYVTAQLSAPGSTTATPTHHHPHTQPAAK